MVPGKSVGKISLENLAILKFFYEFLGIVGI